MDHNIMACINNLENEIKRLNFFVEKYFSCKLESLDKELQRLRLLFENTEPRSQQLPEY